MKPVKLFLLAAALGISVLATPAMSDTWSLFGGRGERGSGDIVTEKREVTEFEQIRLDCSANLVISIDSVFRVSVTTDDNLQDNIITEVISRKTLLIDSEGNFNTHRGVLVEITTPRLVQVEVNGSGDVEISGLKEETFEIALDGSGDIEFEGEVGQLDITLDGSGQITSQELSAKDVKIELGGSGDIELRGKAQTLECTLSGSGNIDARRFETERVDAETQGSGDISVYATKHFDGAVYGSGDIDVYGNPENLKRNTPGSGEIHRRR
ncbi:MAG: DUF2807 domain-containing protein [candidate division Zixibacteria bacterium]|nr:DUF2807 domain-containing protein [candidate division Zixibacteria bacterium]